MEDKLNEKNIWMKCTTYEYQSDFKFVIEQKTPHYQNLPKKNQQKNNNDPSGCPFIDIPISLPPPQPLATNNLEIFLEKHPI